MIYAIADIHGHLAQLERALGLIEQDGGRDAPVVFLGDYVDRGPDSAAVLQTLMDGQAAGRNWTCLKGNHDRLFQIYLESGALNDGHLHAGLDWLDPRLGGRETLASFLLGDEPGFLSAKGGGLETLAAYGVSPDFEVALAELYTVARRHVPPQHLEFLQNLPTSHRAQGMIFVHAGLRPGIALEDQDESDLLWIREPFLSDPCDHGALVVHGHTALDHPQHHGNRVNLDGGAGFGNLLVPAVFEDGACFTLTDQGRVPLVPEGAAG